MNRQERGKREKKKANRPFYRPRTRVLCQKIALEHFGDRIKTLTFLSLVVLLVVRLGAAIAFRSVLCPNKEGEPTRSYEPSIGGRDRIVNSCFRRSNGHATNPSSNSRDPVPSPYRWKGKCRKDIHPTESL